MSAAPQKARPTMIAMCRRLQPCIGLFEIRSTVKDDEQQGTEKKEIRANLCRINGFGLQLTMQPSFIVSRPPAIDFDLWDDLMGRLLETCQTSLHEAKLNRDGFRAYLKLGIYPPLGAFFYYCDPKEADSLYFLWVLLQMILLTLLLSFAIEWAIDRPIAAALPRRIDEALHDLAPQFLRCGYDLRFEVDRAACFSTAACVRVIPIGTGARLQRLPLPLQNRSSKGRSG